MCASRVIPVEYAIKSAYHSRRFLSFNHFGVVRKWKCGRRVNFNVSTVLRSSLLLLALAPLVYYLLSLYNIIDYFRSIRRLPPRDDSAAPPVSILKPVRGMDSEAYENFASYCRLNYPRLRNYFCSKRSGRPGHSGDPEIAARFSRHPHSFDHFHRTPGTKQQNQQPLPPGERSSIRLAGDDRQ